MIYKLVGKIPIPPFGDWEKLLWYVVWRPNSDQLHVCGGRAVYILRRRSEGLDLVKSMVLEIHKKSIRKIAFSADGCLMALASFDSKVSVWKINGQDEWVNISMIEGHQNEVKGVDFQPHPRNPNQIIIATCGRDHTVWIWTHDPQEDPPKEDGSIEFCCSAFLSNHTQDVKAVYFHPSQMMLMSGSFDNTTKVYQQLESEDGQLEWSFTQSLEDHSDTVWDIAFETTGKYFATCGADSKLCIYEIANRQKSELMTTLLVPGSLLRTAMKPSGTSADKGGSVVDLNFTVQIDTGKMPIMSLDWGSFNGQDVIFVGCCDNSIRILTNSDGEWAEALKIPQAHESDINCVRWNCKRKELASCGDDGFVKVWQFV